MAKITPFLCIDVQAEEATRIYTFRPDAETKGLQFTRQVWSDMRSFGAFFHTESLSITMNLVTLSRWHNGEALRMPISRERSTKILN